MDFPKAINKVVFMKNGEPGYRLAQRFISHQSHASVVVPKGFIYDGASIPRFAWSILGMGPDGLIREAALIHDWIYINKGTVNYRSPWNFDLNKICFTRKQCDKLFLKMMLDYQIKKTTAKICYYTVRAAGWYLWNKKKRKN